MGSGNVVEYIDQQKILCAVVLEVKNQRLRLLTENNREVNLSANRLSHKCKTQIDLSAGRNMMVKSLKEIAGLRKKLINHVDIKGLWEIFGFSLWQRILNPDLGYGASIRLANTSGKI